ncbi:hypothetical protein [Candidatus Solincola sp.]|nr:B-box zinc finger protein [Actinomycetota bacterium]MDI7252545.1 B-box zinc finger protein [Actinomycetota bacterium]
MNCPRHPQKRAVATCRECGTGFCIECVRETDQTTLCPECHRRRIDEFSRELAPPGEKGEATAARPSPVAAGTELREEALKVPPSLSEEPGMPEGYASAARPEAGGAKTVSPQPVESGRFWKRTRKDKEPGRAEWSPALEVREGTIAAGEVANRLEEKSGGETDFLSLGPDEDFSELAKAGERRRFRFPGRRRPAAKEVRGKHEEGAAGGYTPGPEEMVASEESRAGGRARPGEGDVIPSRTGRGPDRPREPESVPSTAAAAPDEALLDDVVSRLLRPEGGRGRGEPAKRRGPDARTPDADSVEEVLSTLLRPETGAPARPRAGRDTAAALEERLADAPAPSLAVEEAAPRISREERRRGREERAERWSFLAQPRSSEHTEIASRWWKAALFILLMLVLGVVLWAVPNAYLVPRDTEYGIHAVSIGIILGLLFWWKAGRKHGTKLAVQAALTTFFALFLGEFLHWFLIITKNAALRTIFFDLISFRFIWEHGAEIMRHTMEAMFPGAFIWIMVMPTLLAFIVGFGMPPIPEIFFQFGRAVRE